MNTSLQQMTEEKKIFSLYDLSIEEMYPNKPMIQANNWEKWTEVCSEEEIKFLTYIRDSYKEIEKLGIRTVEVIEPLSNDGFWIQQYPHNYVKQKYPEFSEKSIPHVVFAYTLDKDLHLELDSSTNIVCRMYNITKGTFMKFLQFLNARFTKHFFLSDSLVLLTYDPNAV